MKLSSRNTFFLLFVLAVIGILAGPLTALIRFALDTEHSHASQIVLIPLVSAALIFMNRKTYFQNVRFSVLPGLATIALGAVLAVVASTVGRSLDENDSLAVWATSTVVLWLGGFCLFYGVEVFRKAIFPLLFMVFFIPIPSPVLERTITILQRGSTEMAFLLLKLSGTPVLRESAYIIRLPDLIIEVAPQCSGIRSGISLLISSLLAGHLFLRSTGKRAVLVFATIPILIFKNALRISTLSYLAVHIDKRILTSQLHREGGIPFFIIGLLLLYPILAMLIKSERKVSSSTPGPAVKFEPLTASNSDSGHI